MGEVLRVPLMRRLWTAQLVSTFGDFLALFAVISFLTFKLHATPAQVTNLQISYLLPIAVLGILAGVFVDRWPIKTTMVASDLTRAALCLLLLAASTLGQFYLILASISVLSSFFNPAQGVAIRSAVPLHGLRSAQALMQQVLFGMRIVGPPLAVLLFKFAGPKLCYIGDSLSFVASGSLIASVAIARTIAPRIPASSTPEQQLEAQLDAAERSAPEPPVAQPARPSLASILPDMRQGLAFIGGHSGVLFVTVALAAGMFILGCFGPLIAVYVRDTLHRASGTYSAVSLTIGVGLFLGVNALNTAGKNVKNTILVYAGLGGIALGLILLALIPHVWAAILANLLIGASVSGIVVPANTLIQQETPPALMGRVGSTSMSLIFSAQILGLVLSGVLADRIGVRHVFVVCAALLVLLIAAGKLFMEPKPVSQTA
jgi:DHA3 family macrolide efflux protein-like MFS transporter